MTITLLYSGLSLKQTTKKFARIQFCYTTQYNTKIIIIIIINDLAISWSARVAKSELYNYDHPNI